MNSELEFAKNSASWLLTWSWQVLLLLGAIWLMLKLSHLKSPALRHQIWLVGLIAVVALPICAYITSHIKTRQADQVAYVYLLTIPEVVTAPSSLATIKTVPEKIAITANGWHYLLWPTLFLAWVLGVSLALLRLGAGLLTTYRLRQTAERVSLDELGCGITHSVPIGLSVNAQTPMLIGLLRPMILLPADIVDWTNQAERRAILHHEIAHLERRDQYINALQTLLKVIFFFHPAIHYTCRQMSLECELACDDRVVSLGAKAEIYAESILKVAERNIAPRGLHQPAFYSTKQFLERRIIMILNPDRLHTIKHSWRFLVLVISLTAAITLFLSSGTTTGKSQPKSQDDSESLVEQALSSSSSEDRLAALQHLADRKGEQSLLLLLEVYKRSSDTKIKEMVIYHLGERIQIQTLIAILQVESSSELRSSIMKTIKEVITRKQPVMPSGTPPPPPPPPPPPHMFLNTLPSGDYKFQVVGTMTRNLLNPIGFTTATMDGNQAVELQLPGISLKTPSLAKKEGALYLLDRFE
ncbi:MAG: M56 family metallopeptidase, partial [Acidobacteriota bacterium]